MLSPRASNRGGFSLIEFLVVIAIIAVLVAITLPAVQNARAAALRTQCLSNLQQVGYALHQYQFNAHAFPAAKRTNPAANWVVDLLPLLEQQNMHKLYSFDKAWNDPANQGAVANVLKVLACPSAPSGVNRFETITLVGGAKGKVGVSDYGPTTSVWSGLADRGLIAKRASYAGLLQPDKLTPIDDVRDGLSHTLLIAEDAGRPEHWTRRGKGPASAGPFDSGNDPVVNGRVTGAGWADPSNDLPIHSFSEDGLKSPGPCAINCTNNNEIYSFHKQGVQVVFGDCSARFIRQSININTLATLVTRDGGEPAPALD
jgi:prepilin-type N-terminal cleavage/methylation domain-containing protein